MQIYKIDKLESDRINVLKAIMCSFVCFIHSYVGYIEPYINTVGDRYLYLLTCLIGKYICDCAVPVFIFLSSILLYCKELNWTKNIRRKIVSLGVPYILFNSLYIIWECIKSLIQGERIKYASYGLYEWLNAYLGLEVGGGFKPEFRILWFLRDLILLNILALIIKKFVNWRPIVMIITTLIIWLVSPADMVIHNYTLVFWILGYYVVKYDLRINWLDKKVKMQYLLPIWGVILAVDFYLRNVLEDLEWIHRIFILLSILLVLKFSRWIKYQSCVKEVADASFWIYLIHMFLFETIQIIFKGVTSIPIYWLLFLIKPCIAIIVGVFLYKIMLRFTPALLGFITGGRIIKT